MNYWWRENTHTRTQTNIKTEKMKITTGLLMGLNLVRAEFKIPSFEFSEGHDPNNPKVGPACCSDAYIKEFGKMIEDDDSRVSRCRSHTFFLAKII